IELSVFLGHGKSSMGIVSPIEVSGVIRPAQAAVPTYGDLITNPATYRGGNCIQALHPRNAAVQAQFPRSYCGSDPFIYLFYVRALRPIRFLAHTRVDAYPRGDFFCGEDSDRRTFAAGGSAQRGGGNCSYRQPLLGLFRGVNFCLIVGNGFRKSLNEKAVMNNSHRETQIAPDVLKQPWAT
ncbi:hypothetical protein, partial [Pseudomonas viridiflava]